MMNLQHATRDELIRELVNRPHFAGCVVWYTGDMKHIRSAPESQIHLSNSARLGPARCVALLARGVQQLSAIAE